MFTVRTLLGNTSVGVVSMVALPPPPPPDTRIPLESKNAFAVISPVVLDP